MANRISFWEEVSAYTSQMASLWHGNAGDALRSLIRKNNPKNICADFGCGPGYWLEALAFAHKLYAVGFSSNMLDQAKERAPIQTEFLQQNLSELSLPNPVDFALRFNAIMPEGHADALQIFRRLCGAMAEGGTLIVVVPAFDALIYSANAVHFHEADQGREEVSLRERLDTWSAWYSNPLGYVRNGNDTIVKYWLREEFEAVVQMVGGMSVADYIRLDRVKNTTGENPPEGCAPSWYHCWVLKNYGAG